MSPGGAELRRPWRACPGGVRCNVCTGKGVTCLPRPAPPVSDPSTVLCRPGRWRRLHIRRGPGAGISTPFAAVEASKRQGEERMRSGGREGLGMGGVTATATRRVGFGGAVEHGGDEEEMEPGRRWDGGGCVGRRQRPRRGAGLRDPEIFNFMKDFINHNRQTGPG